MMVLFTFLMSSSTCIITATTKLKIINWIKTMKMMKKMGASQYALLGQPLLSNWQPFIVSWKAEKETK